MEYFDQYSDHEIASAMCENKVDYDDKFILRRLMEGYTRDDIAKELMHKNYRTLDMYMRRHGYTWDTINNQYIKRNSLNSSINIDTTSSSSKVQKILDMLDSGGDPREIARLLGLKDHRNMAEYMKSKGYIWSSEKQNYILNKGKMEDDILPENHFKNYNNTHSENTDNILDINATNMEDLVNKDLTNIVNLLPILNILNKNKDKLEDILGVNNSNTIPRYVVGGINITKSLCMSHNLSELVKQFSKEKNLSQREIFEVAIVEFLRKYGYENEINAIFNS